MSARTSRERSYWVRPSSVRKTRSASRTRANRASSASRSSPRCDLRIEVRVKQARALVEGLQEGLGGNVALHAEDLVVGRPVEAAVRVPDEIALRVELLGDAGRRRRAGDVDVQVEQALRHAGLLERAPGRDEEDEARRREAGDDPLVRVDLLDREPAVDAAEDLGFDGRDGEGLIAHEEIRREDGPGRGRERARQLGRRSREPAERLEEEAAGGPVGAHRHVGRRVERRHREDPGGPAERFEEQPLRERADRRVGDVVGNGPGSAERAREAAARLGERLLERGHQKVLLREAERAQEIADELRLAVRAGREELSAIEPERPLLAAVGDEQLGRRAFAVQHADDLGERRALEGAARQHAAAGV